MKKKMIKLVYQVSDYEHSGDLEHGIAEIQSISPNARILRSWEEEDYESEADYENDYGEAPDEGIYQGYIEFEVPADEVKLFEHLL